MSSAQVLQLATAPVAGRSGAIAAARRFQVRNQRTAGNVRGNSDQEEFLDDLERLSLQHAPTTQYMHPGDRAARNPNAIALTPADLMWLQRLPRNPAEISFDDAAAIAGMAASISQSSSPSDARLIRSIWNPIRAHHDALAARADLKAAQTPLPAIPSSAVGALAAALRAELPDHTDAEVISRAEQALTEVLAGRESQRAQRIAKAEDAVATANAAEQHRTETVRAS